MKALRTSAGPPSGGRVAHVAREEPGLGDTVRVLVAFERAYRSYGQTFAYAIRSLRPCAEVTIAEPATLENELSRLDPDLVISSTPDAPGRGGAQVWFEVSTEPGLPANVRVGGRRTALDHPDLQALLWAVDEAERLSRADRRSGAPAASRRPGTTRLPGESGSEARDKSAP